MLLNTGILLMTRDFARRLMLAIAMMLSVAGCAINYSIKPELLPAAPASAMVEQWPLAVGLYIPASVRNHEFTEGRARVQAGAELASTFGWALSQKFARVVELDASPQKAGIPKGLAGAVELANVSLNKYPSLAHEEFVYDIVFYSTGGEGINEWLLVSHVGGSNIWDIERSSPSASLQSIGTSLSYAIRNQTAMFLVGLEDQPAVKYWLEAAHIRPAKGRPFIATSPDIAPEANGVMILPDLDTWRYTDNSSAMDCVGKRLRVSSPPVEIVLTDSVRNEFYPWLEPSTAPKSIDSLRTWLSEPAIKEKMRRIGIRYLLSVQGGTSTSIPGGGIFCAPNGCIGFAYGSHESSFTATIVDLQSEEQPREVTSRETSGVYVPAFMLPIPFLAPTEAAACERLAKDIHAVILKSRQ